eukprot:1178251-Pyramimonas_sp.AAC.1
MWRIHVRRGRLSGQEMPGTHLRVEEAAGEDGPGAFPELSGAVPRLGDRASQDVQQCGALPPR